VSRPLAVICLAAGLGKRTKVSLPKVLLPLCGRTLVASALAAVAPLQPQRTVVVLSNQKDKVQKAVQEACGGMFARLDFVDQGAPRGTGHAVQAAMQALDANDDRWQKANEAFIKAQREAFTTGEDGPTDEQWKAVEVARMALTEVHEAISEAFDKVLSERARSAQRDVAAAIERVAQARSCSAVHQRSALWGRELPADAKTGKWYLNPVYLMIDSGARGNITQM
jgi:hypothetical protein